MRWLALLLVAGCIPSPTPRLAPMEPQEPTPVQWPIAARRIHDAEGYVVGRIAKLEEDWTYDDVCGLVTILRRGCMGTVTYRMRIDPAGMWLWTFTPAYGTFGLYVGERGVFVYSRVVAYRYAEKHPGMGDYVGYDLLPALTDDLDVLPVADSARVDSLRHR